MTNDKLDRREFLQTSQSGGYCSSTLSLINERKYHSMLVHNLENSNSDNISLIATIDETIISAKGNYELGNHAYPGVMHPNGYQYITSAQQGCTTYSTPAGELTKEIALSRTGVLFVRYTLRNATTPIQLRVMPLFNYRSIHHLSHENNFVDNSVEYLNRGVRVGMYPQYPKLSILCSSDCDFIRHPDWYRNIEYPQEQIRGYDYTEDLYSYGAFEIKLAQGESVVMCYTPNKLPRTTLEKSFVIAQNYSKLGDTLYAKLQKSGESFVVTQAKERKIVAGYPWFGAWGRDTFIALPGLLLSNNPSPESAMEVIDSMIKELKQGLFINMGSAYNSVDAPMWFFVALQRVGEITGNNIIAERYYSVAKSIIESYARGDNQGITLDENGLIHAKIVGKALTWCDALVDGAGVTPRYGYSVEVCAMWYNALVFALELAKIAKDREFIATYKSMPAVAKASFQRLFWNKECGYLADSIDDGVVDISCRSNQIVATSLPNSPLTIAQRKSVMRVVRERLLVECGLRTLAQGDINYRGECVGTQRERDLAYHNGTVWVWQLEYYVRCGYELYGQRFNTEAKSIFKNFETIIEQFCVGSIAEIFDGNKPHTPRGSIAQAWSVSALLSIRKMIVNNSR